MQQKKPFKIVKLEFISPLHIGLGTSDQYDSMDTILHSDTISGALASAYVSLFGNEQVLEFMQSFRISSAFPFHKNHYFLPKPMMRIKLDRGNKEKDGDIKSLKKLEYIELPLYEKLIAGNTIKVTDGMQPGNKKFLWADDNGDHNSLMKTSMQQRVMVPRSGTEDTKPYYIERLFFTEGSGLFFFIEVSEETFSKVFACIGFLETSGFGTDKSVGNGQFKSSHESISFALPDKADKHLLLSLYCPRKEEISEESLTQSAYLLTKRGGFIAGTSLDKFRHLRKRSIYMMREGSVLHGDVPDGKITNLRPTWNDDDLHPVWRDGRAFSLPVVLSNA
jgi:CRISPR type III-A-associated RAMP protein Csm4